ncbi:zinc-dependent alcohol dehydrogenase family protein [Parafilimonas sp.]|uniref:zinc-dependent alcohol dehydrogenase family protein n=1 Tax=Parafilimonas sp. TaxID=1969739 RepID=UPI0039E51804
MQALTFDKTGNPEDVLKICETDKPVPKNGEVLIKVLMSPINPADILFITGKYRFQPVFPQTAGMEGCGIVEAVSNDVTGIQRGSLVAFFSMNVWAEYVVANSSQVFVLPADFNREKAAQFCLNPFTAYGLLQAAHVKENDWLLITAGSSAVAKIVTQLAKGRQARVILAIRNMQYAGALKKLGADEVIDITKDDWDGQILSVTQQKGVNAALDTLGGEAGTRLLNIMAANATIVLYAAINKDNVSFHNAQFVYKQLTLKGFGIRHFLDGQTAAEKNKMITSLTAAMANSAFECRLQQHLRLPASDRHWHQTGKIPARAKPCLYSINNKSISFS